MSRPKARRWAVVGALSLVAVAACTPGGGGGEGEGDGQMTWAIGGAEAQVGGIHQKVAQKWSEENPETPIEIEILPDAADQQREQHALELQAEGTAFDVLGMDVIWTGEYAENGWVESLEDARADLEEGTLPGAVQSAQWGGEMWAAPYNTNAGFLYYRTDLVDQPPTTWEEMCEIAARVGKQEGIGGFIGQGARYEGFVVNWLEYFWSAGGELYNEDQTEVTFDTAAATKATEFLADAEQSGCLAPGFNTAQEEEARNEFQSGNTVFMRNCRTPTR